ncbi:DUF58 domain-containing protein [Solwaraspora sp. WMMB335]|uniref:DUF58 domain-containing protein n=1 Tax=Solwaraspora sp. WMMB335 TaxID=3404118 RepID=UPI003B939C97
MTTTPRCLGLSIAAALLTAAGSVLDYPEIALLGAAGLTVVAYAGGYVAWQPRLTVRRSVEPDRVGRGERCQVSLVVGSARRWGTVSLLAQERCGRRSLPVALDGIRVGGQTTIRYAVPTDRRGVLQIGPLQVLRRDPFGLVSVVREHGEPVQIWVRPRVYALQNLPVGVARSLDGRTDRVPHGSITFDSLREYVVGDELRRVHWRATARLGRLMVREQVDTSLPRLVVLLDNRAAAHPDGIDATSATFEAACEAAASVVSAAIRAGLGLSLWVVADQPPRPTAAPSRPSPPVSTHPMDRLAEVTLTADDRITGADALRVTCERLRHQRPGDTLVFLTGTGDPDAIARVGALRTVFASVLIGRITGAVPAGTATRDPAGTAAVHRPGGPAHRDGVLVVEATDGAGFAAAWDAVGAW